jgi:hypothetical protein
MTTAPTKTAKATPKATLGFGVPASNDPHHFKIIIPRATNGKIQISEYLGLQATSDDFAVIDRVLLERSRWVAVRDAVQRHFNARLKANKLKTSAWKIGENMVDRLLGKELCVLAWAIEAMQMENIALAVRNWLALQPEERWWLFGITASNTGNLQDSHKGWRLALKHALGDVAYNEKPTQNYRKQLASCKQSGQSVSLSLFGD